MAQACHTPARTPGWDVDCGERGMGGKVGHRLSCRPEGEPKARHYLEQILGQSFGRTLCWGKVSKDQSPQKVPLAWGLLGRSAG